MWYLVSRMSRGEVVPLNKILVFIFDVESALYTLHSVMVLYEQVVDDSMTTHVELLPNGRTGTRLWWMLHCLYDGVIG